MILQFIILITLSIEYSLQFKSLKDFNKSIYLNSIAIKHSYIYLSDKFFKQHFLRRLVLISYQLYISYPNSFNHTYCY